MGNKLYNRFKKIIFPLFVVFSVVTLFFQFNFENKDPFSGKSKSLNFIQKVHAEEDTDPIDFQRKFTPNSNYLQNQWNLNLMNIGEAWADGYNGKGIKIAVLDTGFYYKHPDIVMTGGDSVFSDDPWSLDHSGHGTHIAGIISAKKGTSYQGVAPDAEVFGVKIYHSDDISEFGDVSTDVGSVIKGIRLAMENESDIIVISSGLNYHDEELYSIIKEAHHNNIMIIAASGNGNLTVNYPASYSEVIAVTAVDEDLNPALDIIYGQENEFTAPGVHIGGLSIPESSYSYPYIYMSGSSQATPHAAGLAAIFMQKYNKRGEEIREIMKEQAIDIGDSGLFGHGLLHYQSKKEIEEDKINENINALTEQEKNKDKNDEENSEARKPSSAREAEKEDEINEEENLKKSKNIEVTIKEGTEASIDGDSFPSIEMGGYLEIYMDDANSLRLNESQISDIRQKNIRLILRKEGISWKIPPSNFLPGQAILRFYEGQPIGTKTNPNTYSNIYTISIFQARTRKGVYPGWMEVTFDLNKYPVADSPKLNTAYFDNSKDDWIDLEKELDENTLILKTKQTGALGLFELEEKVKPDEKEENQIFSPSLAQVFIFASLILFLILRTIKKLLTNQNK